jgi:hypothetical protein
VARLRDKYAAKMAEGPDRRAFDVATSGIGINSAEFRAVTRIVAAVDTLSGFLRDLRERYPEVNAFVPGTPHRPAMGPMTPGRADQEPTGSVPRPGRLSAR